MIKRESIEIVLALAALLQIGALLQVIHNAWSLL
jgi:hypothetical protein